MTKIIFLKKRLLKKILNFTFCLLACSFYAKGESKNDRILKKLYLNFYNQILFDRSSFLTELGSIVEDKYTGDQVILDLYQSRMLKSDSVRTLISSLEENGQWKNIDYLDKSTSGWNLKTHLDQLLQLTKTFYDKKSPFFRNKALKITIHNALNYWLTSKPKNNNWWYNEIGIPQVMGPLLLLLKHDLSKGELQAGLQIMEQAKFGRTGQNKVWLAGNVFYKALLTDDYLLAKQARDSIISEIKIVSGEGINPDFSFQQHGPQQQFGNYGLAFISNMSVWGMVFKDTDLKFNREQITILRKFFIIGYQQLVWNGYLDYNSLGRQYFKNAQLQKGFAIAIVADNLSKIDKAHSKIYRTFIHSNFIAVNKEHQICQTNYFCSDMSVHRFKNWTSTIKMSSNRVIGAEGNDVENLKGYYTADGAYSLLINGNEYENIYPIWDWRNLPGVTNYLREAPLATLGWKGYRNNSDFVGGLSNGRLGITVFNLNRDSLSAKKGYFFLNDQLICLGSEITSKLNETVITTINQSWLKDSVEFCDKFRTTLSSESSLNSKHLKWVYHNNVTYVPLQHTMLDVNNKTKRGSWSDIMRTYPTDTISGKIFTVNVSPIYHPKNNSYAYAILPNYYPKNDSVSLNFKIVENSGRAQIIQSIPSNILMVIAYLPFTQNFPTIGSVSFTEAGVYLFESDRKNWKVTVADPTQKLKTIKISIKDKISTFSLPSGYYKGKSITKFIDR